MKSFLLALSLLPALANAAPAPFVFGSDGKSINLQTGISLPQSTTPAAPVTGRDYLYFKSDDHLYLKTHAGTETQVDGGGGGVSAMAAYGSTPNANGGSISGANLTLQPASTAFPGGMIVGAQTVAGQKTVQAQTLTDVPLSLQGAASQSGDLLQFKTSTPTTLGQVAADGQIVIQGTKGLTVGQTTGQNDALYIKQSATGDTGFVMGNSNNTRKVGFDYSNTGAWFLGNTGTNYTMALSDSTAGNTGKGWFSWGANGPAGPVIPWPMHFNTIAADGAITALSSFVPLDGLVVNSLPIVVAQNKSSTVNTIQCWGTAGSSSNLMGGICTRHVIQTAASEQSDVFLVNQNSGTQTEVMKIRQNGNTEHHGVAPTVSACGTSPSIVGNNNDMKVTVGTGGIATSCLVTFATTPAWTNSPICVVNDETGIITVQAVPTTTTVTLNAVAAFAASSVLDVHCSGYF